MMTTPKFKYLILSGMFAAIIAVISQLVIPLPLVPITGQTLAVGLTATILGSRYGTLSVLVYIALGAVGVPVFAEAKAGIQILFGPTGGFILGFIATVYITGLILEKTSFSLPMAL